MVRVPHLATTTQSDVDVMVLAACRYLLPFEERRSFDTNFSKNRRRGKIYFVMHKVPYERKLLIPISFAEATPRAVPFIKSPPKTICKTAQYLNSYETLYRLVFNGLTVPTIELGGSLDIHAAQKVVFWACISYVVLCIIFLLLDSWTCACIFSLSVLEGDNAVFLMKKYPLNPLFHWLRAILLLAADHGELLSRCQ